MNKNTTLTYLFSVEGETELIYLNWLKKEINLNQKRTANVQFQVEKLKPISFAKLIKGPSPSVAYHIIDIEKANEENFNNFIREINDMSYVTKKMASKIKIYILGYSNLSFELWLILHNMQFTTPILSCKDYLTSLNKAFNRKFQSLDNFKKEKELNSLLNTLNLNNVLLAINNAEKLMTLNMERGYSEQNHKKYRFYKENPSLSIHTIIKNILKDIEII